MAIKDVFNNSTDNYLKTGLSPCEGSDDNIFQFFPKKEVGVASGNKILSEMYLGDLQVQVTAWEQHRKVLGPQEIIYVQGLTKELDNRTQVFDFLTFVPDTSLFYKGIEITLNYYDNFKNVTINVIGTSDPVEGIAVDDALNLALASLNIGITAAATNDYITFTGTNEGYNFDITGVIMTDYDSSMVQVGLSYSLSEDTSKSIPYAKYINGAMLGLVLKAKYPDDQSTYDKWLNLSHVNNTFSYYDSSTYVTKYVDTGSSNTSTSTTICAGDYLNYISVNNMWDKIGYLYMKINTFDQDDSLLKNLVPGFYVFNPHSFSVEIEYMMIN